jgi:tetratricopeptide (TPR) repeat protein
MSKKTRGRPTPSRLLVQKLDQVAELLEKKRPSEALPILKDLERKHPNDDAVLGLLTTACIDLNDWTGYEAGLRRLARLRPREADIALALIGAYAHNMRPALALQQAQNFLSRWPDHAEVAHVRRDLALFEKATREQIEETGLPDEQALDVIIQLEEQRFYLAMGQYHQARQIGEKALRRFPDFIPVLNNLGQVYAVNGDLEHSIQIAKRVLEIDPQNLHAISNLARLHFLNGQPEQAQEFATLLKASRAQASDRWNKIAEALTFLGDDAGVLALYEQAKKAGELEPPFVDEIFYHLLAVSALNLGQEKDARRFWKKALKLSPGFNWVQENLADLDRPLDKRQGAWAFPFENWLLGNLAIDLARTLEKNKPPTAKPDREKGPLQRILSHFLEKHPRLLFLAPHLLRRGDEKARQFVMHLAAASHHPQLVQLVLDFIGGQQGSVSTRMEAAHYLSEAGLLPASPLRIWSGGEQREVLMLNMEINPEPEDPGYAPLVQELAEQAYAALQQSDGRRAQELLEKAVAMQPDAPSLLNNLAMAYEKQGQSARAHQMIGEIHTRFPNYSFGIIGVAGLAIRDGDLETASELLNSLMQREKLHTSEFAALCTAQMDLNLAEGQDDGARNWLEMLEQTYPDHPRLPYYRRRLGKPGRKK